MQYRFRQCVLDTTQFALFRDGVKADVDPQVLRLFEYLIVHRDRVVPRGDLFDEVFSGRIVTDNALSVRVRAARVAVGDSASEQSRIATITGLGYRFVAEVHVVSHAEARREQTRTESAVDEGQLAGLAVAEPTVAVLPFEVIGGKSEHTIIARGLVHDVTTRIARSRAMYVIARGTSFQFASGTQDVREIGAKLGIRYVAQGAVQITGRKIRISIALASTETARVVGSWQYDRELGDVLHIQDEIAILIVSEIEVEIQRQEMQRSTLMPSTNLDAWSAYHQGLGHMYRFRSRECDKAEIFFRRALDLEP